MQEDARDPTKSWLRQFSNTETAEVATFINGKGSGMQYELNTNLLQPWSWLEMVAQLNEASLAFVVNGADNSSGGLVECWFAMRPNSYDHKRHIQRNHGGKP